MKFISHTFRKCGYDDEGNDEDDSNINDYNNNDNNNDDYKNNNNNNDNNKNIEKITNGMIVYRRHKNSCHCDVSHSPISHHHILPPLSSATLGTI